MRSTDLRLRPPSFTQTALALVSILAWSSCGGSADGGAADGGEDPTAPAVDEGALEPALRARLAERRAALEAQPDSAAAWGAFGLACDVHGLVAPAASAYSRASELDPADVRWPYFHGIAVLATEPRAAAGLFEQALALEPERVALHVMLARARLASEELDAAHEGFEAALALAPDTPAARLGLASIALLRGDVNMALEELERARAAGTTTGEVDRLEAQARRTLGELDRAVVLERRAGASVELEPVEDPLRAAAVATEGVTLRWRRSRALAALAQGRTAEALAELERAVAAGPTSARPLSALGDLCLRAGKAERALEAYDRALALEAEDAELHLGRANSLSSMGRVDEATAAYARAVELDPGLHVAQVNQGALLVQSGRTEEGLALLQAACEGLPDDADAWFNYGQALMQAERFDDAVGAYGRARQIDPAHRARFELAGVLMRARRHEEAAAELEALAELDPGRAVVHTNLALVWRRAGRDDKAVAACRRGLEVLPKDPTLLRELALLLSASPDDSVRDVKAARIAVVRLAINPDLRGSPLAMQVDAIVRAEEGRFGLAVELVDKARDLLETAGLPPAFAATVERELEDQRALYLTGVPFRRGPDDR